MGSHCPSTKRSPPGDQAIVHLIGAGALIDVRGKMNQDNLGSLGGCAAIF